jgi:hypothetical protein
MAIAEDIRLKSRVADAVSRMMHVSAEGQSVRVAVPVLYPSGATAVIELFQSGNDAYVSDMGLGQAEAEFEGASDHYVKQAKFFAEKFGVSFDGFSIFLARAPLNYIESAIAAVANASSKAVGQAIMKAAEDRDYKKNDQVYDRLRQALPEFNIMRAMELRGARAAWQSHNVVTLRSGKHAVFEYVSPHANAISNKYLMFSDLSQSEDGPLLNVVSQDLYRLGEKGLMLQDVANMIELQADNDHYRSIIQQAA